MLNRSIALLALSLMLLLGACGETQPVGAPASRSAMIDVTRSAFTPAPKVDGWPGLALFDYDNDGDIDIFVANPPGLPNMFYRNDGPGSFSYAAVGAGLALVEESCIVPGVGDFDNDGWLDLIIARQSPFFGVFAPNDTLLYMKNTGPDEDGIVRFVDVTEQAGLSGITYGSSIGVGDFDNDGLLDLYIGRYNIHDLEFTSVSYLPDTPNVLLHNTGITDGVPRFEDITETAGVAGTRIAGLSPDTADTWNRMPTWAVFCSDVNQDGLLDIFSLQEIPGGVDLFLNNGDLTFSLTQEDLLNRHGGWMGVASADFDRDGHLDYFLANVGGDAKGPSRPYHIANAWSLPNGTPFHLLLKSDSLGRLVDAAAQIPVAPGPLPPANILGGEGLAAYEFGFGCAWLDMDNDGWPDLHWIGDIILSGLVRSGGLRRDFHGVGRFLSNNGDGSFTDRTAERGLFDRADGLPLEFGYGWQGRALAAIDLNGDGFVDICRTNQFVIPDLQNSFACLFNPAEGDGKWLIVRLTGTTSNRFGIGARIEAQAGEDRFVGEVITTTSAFTAVHPQVHFGLGEHTSIDTLTVRWPSGTVTQLSDVAVNQILNVNEEM